MAERSQRTYAKVTSGISWDAFWSALLEEMRLGHMRRMYVCVHRKIDPPWMASHILFAAEDDREIVPPDDPSWRFDLSKGLFPPDIFHGESVAPVSFLRFYELLASLSSFSAVT